MNTKEQAELLTLTAVETKMLKDSAGAIGYAMAALRSGKSVSGYCSPVVLRTLCRAAKIELPAELKRALRKKESSVEISRADLLDLTVQAARNTGADNIADIIIAENRDMPVRKLTTLFPKRSDVRLHTEQLAAERIAQVQKEIGDLKAAGAIDVNREVPTVREVSNEFVLQEIFRFASYTCMGQEVDWNRSKVTKGNVIHLCCSDLFVEALKKARVPGVGQFLPAGQRETSKDGWPNRVQVAEWPYPAVKP